MAKIIPTLNRQTLSRMTPGEKRVARRLEDFLEDDYLIWYDIPVGSQGRYPDFIILHPARGLLFLEVKDWKPETIKKIDKSRVTLLTDRGLTTELHPLEQVRQYTYSVLKKLERDPKLHQETGKYEGKLVTPYGWGVVFTNITRSQIEKAIPEEARESLLPDHLVIYKNEITKDTDPEKFQEQLWSMFHYQFGTPLTLPQIDRIRWHLFPEIRINEGIQHDLFYDDIDDNPDAPRQTIPDIVKIMDVQQEKLARGLGEGHRVIHGVAGSGKTMILGYRCLHLARTSNKPILVLCFNITLAARLKKFIASKGINEQVQVYHFHDWCSQQIKTYHVKLVESNGKYYEQLVETVIRAVDKGKIPRAQYGAVLIDEGHDLDADWLKLVVQMVDPETDSLLLLYDDAQSIYKKNRSSLGFSLSSVGIKAVGRTTVLRLNYRNTREILRFAYTFACHYFMPQNADDDHIPLIEPEAGGNSGAEPAVCRLNSFYEEIEYTKKCLSSWHSRGIAWSDMAVLFPYTWQGAKIALHLKKAKIPYLLADNKEHKASYDPSENRVTISTFHSSKGLEFPRVIITGVGQMKDREECNARLLYVGMTRAQRFLLITTSADNEFSRRLITSSSGVFPRQKAQAAALN